MTVARRFSAIVPALLILALLAQSAPAAAGLHNFHPAKLVLFQKDMQSRGEFDEAANTAKLGSGGNIFVSNSGMLIVPDRHYRRLLVYKTEPTTNFAAADLIIKQDVNNDFLFAEPMDACLGPSGQLIAVDRTWHRILIWNTFPTTGKELPDVVLGQPNGLAGKSVNGGKDVIHPGGFSSPEAVAVHGNKLLLADRSNSRVLVWNSIPSTAAENGRPADVIVGQEAGNTGTFDRWDAVYMSSPRGIAVSMDGKLIVPQSSSSGSNRVMIWNSIPTANGKAANVVLGVEAFDKANFDGSRGAAGLWDPIGASVSPSGKLAVADHNNGRVLVWNSIPTTNGKAADVVLGQRTLAAVDFDQEYDERFIGGPVGVDWTADERLWVMSLHGTGMAKLFDPAHAPVIPDYFKPSFASPRIMVPHEKTVELTPLVRNGKAPFTWKRQAGHPAPGTFDDKTGVLTASRNNIHDYSDLRPQVFKVTDAKGNVATLEVVVYPPLEVNPPGGAAYTGMDIPISVYGGMNLYPEPYKVELKSNLSGGAVALDPYNNWMYTPGPTAGGKDVLTVSDKEGNSNEIEFIVKERLKIDGFSEPFQTITMKQGETRTFTALGGSGEGYRWGNYNDHYYYNGKEYGHGSISTAGYYTAKRAGDPAAEWHDAVYVNDSEYNAFTVRIKIVN